MSEHALPLPKTLPPYWDTCLDDYLPFDFGIINFCHKNVNSTRMYPCKYWIECYGETVGRCIKSTTHPP